jgi:hypothetical protein
MKSRPAALTFLAIAVAIVSVLLFNMSTAYFRCHPGSFETKAESEKTMEGFEEQTVRHETRGLSKLIGINIDYNALVIRVGAPNALSAEEIKSLWQRVYTKAHHVPLTNDTCTSVRIEDVEGRVLSESN